MKVYVVERNIDYEGSDIEGIFSSHDLAADFVDGMKFREYDMKDVNFKRSRGEVEASWWDISITEFEVDPARDVLIKALEGEQGEIK